MKRERRGLLCGEASEQRRQRRKRGWVNMMIKLIKSEMGGQNDNQLYKGALWVQLMEKRRKES